MFFSIFAFILILVSIYSAFTIKKIDSIPTNQYTTSSTQTKPTSTVNQIPELTTTAIFEPQRPIPQIPKPTVIIETPKQILLRNMKLTFSEEFDSFSRYVDASGNVTCNSGGSGIWQTVYQFCSRTSPANLEAEIYIDQNFIDYLNSQSDIKTNAQSPFSVKNGVMAIEVKPSDEAILKAAGSWATYTSGLLTTEYSFSQLYGYFEIRAKLPTGKGVWPAFWLLPADKSWPPEIDVFEAFGGQNPLGEGGLTSIRHASHPLDKSEACGAWRDVGVDITKDFHTYGVDWQPTGITYYFDDVPYVTCKPNTAANKPFFILANVAVGGPGSWPGTPDESNTWPVYMYIDYIRAYQKK